MSCQVVAPSTPSMNTAPPSSGSTGTRVGLPYSRDPNPTSLELPSPQLYGADRWGRGFPAAIVRMGAALEMFHGAPAWRTYRHRVLEHYGPHMLVPLLECTYPVTGIGLPDGCHTSTSAA